LLPGGAVEYRRGSLRIWAPDRLSSERFSNVRRGKKADQEVRPTRAPHQIEAATAEETL
jgi:hypothetical protein